MQIIQTIQLILFVILILPITPVIYNLTFQLIERNNWTRRGTEVPEWVKLIYWGLLVAGSLFVIDTVFSEATSLDPATTGADGAAAAAFAAFGFILLVVVTVINGGLWLVSFLFSLWKKHGIKANLILLGVLIVVGGGFFFTTG